MIKYVWYVKFHFGKLNDAQQLGRPVDIKLKAIKWNYSQRISKLYNVRDRPIYFTSSEYNVYQFGYVSQFNV